MAGSGAGVRGALGAGMGGRPAGKPDLKKLPRQTVSLVDTLVNGSPWLDWRHFDAGVMKVLQQLACANENEALLELKQVRPLPPSSSTHLLHAWPCFFSFIAAGACVAGVQCRTTFWKPCESLLDFGGCPCLSRSPVLVADVGTTRTEQPAALCGEGPSCCLVHGHPQPCT